MPPEVIPVVMITMFTVFVAFPWMVFHYITKWKQAKTLTGTDEKLLDDLYELSRRLDDRMCTIERIMSADNPNWRQSCIGTADHVQPLLPQDESIELELLEVRRRLANKGE